MSEFKQSVTKESINYIDSIQIRFSADYIKALAQEYKTDIETREKLLDLFEKIAKTKGSDFTCIKSSSKYYKEKKAEIVAADMTEVSEKVEKFNKAKKLIETLKAEKKMTDDALILEVEKSKFSDDEKLILKAIVLKKIEVEKSLFD